MKKNILSLLLALCFLNQSWAQANLDNFSEEERLAGQIRALEEKNAFLIQELHQIKQKSVIKNVSTLEELLGFDSFNRDHNRDCHPPTQTCVANCTWRNSSGNCNSYGEDFCAVDAQCSPHCTWRKSDGTCLSYDADFCGTNAVCSPNCTWRASDGTCQSYGPDVCY